MRELIFWRHGEAGDGSSDLARNLTERGEQQATLTAKWLQQQQVDFPVMTSQANRTQQTASFYRTPEWTTDQLNPGERAGSVIQLIETKLIELDAQPRLVVVGHQPWIGQAIAYFVTGHLSYYGLSTSDLWWLRSENGTHWSVYHKIINADLSE